MWMMERLVMTLRDMTAVMKVATRLAEKAQDRWVIMADLQEDFWDEILPLLKEAQLLNQVLVAQLELARHLSGRGDLK
jgi:hypothetical protein